MVVEGQKTTEEEMIRLIGAALCLLIFVGHSHGQTGKGATIVGLEGTVGAVDGEAFIDANAGVSHMLSDRFSGGVAFGVRKSPGVDAAFDMGANVSYLFNSQPGRQRTIPRIGAFGGFSSGSGNTSKTVGGVLGMRHYFNKSVGVGVSSFYERVFDAVVGSGFSSTSFGFFTTFNRTTQTKDVNNLGVSWSFFVQFGA